MSDRALRDELERLSTELKTARGQLEASRASRAQASAERLAQAKLERAELAARCYALETRVAGLDQADAASSRQAGLERKEEARFAELAHPGPRPWSVRVISWVLELLRGSPR